MSIFIQVFVQLHISSKVTSIEYYTFYILALIRNHSLQIHSPRFCYLSSSKRFAFSVYTDITSQSGTTQKRLNNSIVPHYLIRLDRSELVESVTDRESFAIRSVICGITVVLSQFTFENRYSAGQVFSIVIVFTSYAMLKLNYSYFWLAS